MRSSDDGETSTSAVIVALPAADDPVQVLGPEQSHATILYFGKIDSLNKDVLVQQARRVAALFGPFRAKVTEVEELGDDKAQVLMLDREQLKAIRDELRKSDQIEEYYKAIEQYPSYTAHLTLGYPDGTESEEWRPAAEGTKSIFFDRLAVWFGPEQIEVPLNVELWRPTLGMFAKGQDHLDPRIFDGEHLKPVVRQAILGALDAYWRPLFGDWTQWAKVYLAGSAASYWWDSDTDLDLMVGVDLDRLRQVRPANREVSDADIILRLNKTLMEMRPLTAGMVFEPGTEPFNVTYFVNAGAYDVRAIHPYAALDLTEDQWVVKPPVLPKDWGPDSIPDETWRRCEQVAREARATLALSEPERAVQGTILFDWIHDGRKAAYSAYGGGWLDPGNVIYQYLSQTPDRLLRRLYLCKHPAEATAAEAIEKTAGGSASKTAAGGTFWRLHPEGRPFGVEDAHSKPFFGPGERQQGYSCFDNPWNLYLYVWRMGWPISEGYPVISFPGTKVGVGNDGEDLAMPTGPVTTMTWGDLKRRLPSEPLPPSPKFADWVTSGYPEFASWEALAKRWEYLDQGRPEQDWLVSHVLHRTTAVAAGHLPGGVFAAVAEKPEQKRSTKTAAGLDFDQDGDEDAIGPLSLRWDGYSPQTQQRIINAIEDVQAGRKRPEPKQRELSGYYSVDLDGRTEPERLLFTPVGGQWVAVMFLKQHQYAEAERVIPRWEQSADHQRIFAGWPVAAQKVSSMAEDPRVAEAVAEFLDRPHVPGLTPWDAHDQCYDESQRFESLLKAKGVDAQIIMGYKREDFLGQRVITQGHVGVRVGDSVYDWTARQFEDKAPVPKIVSVDEWVREWPDLHTGSKVAARTLYHGTDVAFDRGASLGGVERSNYQNSTYSGEGVYLAESPAMAFFYAVFGPFSYGNFSGPRFVYEVSAPEAKYNQPGEWLAPTATVVKDVTAEAAKEFASEWPQWKQMVEQMTPPGSIPTASMIIDEFERRMKKVTGMMILAAQAGHEDEMRLPARATGHRLGGVPAQPPPPKQEMDQHDIRLVIIDCVDPEAAASQLAEHLDTVPSEKEALVYPTQRKTVGEWDRALMHDLTKDHGFTMHDHPGDGPKDGFMVSIDQDSEQKIPLVDVTPQAISDYMSIHQQELRDPNNYLGGWVFRGVTYLDISRWVPDREQAMALAKANKQLAIYDLANGQTVMA